MQCIYLIMFYSETFNFHHVINNLNSKPLFPLFSEQVRIVTFIKSLIKNTHNQCSESPDHLIIGLITADCGL